MAEVIYEVNIRIEKEAEDKFLEWLKKHADEMLKFKGFNSANIYRRNPEDESLTDQNHAYLTVQYHVLEKADLEKYLQEHACKMQEEAKLSFGDLYDAHRRVLYHI